MTRHVTSARLAALLGLCAVLCATLFLHGAGSAALKDDSARDFLEAIYVPDKINGGHGTSWHGREQDYFTPERAALLLRDREEAGNDIGRIGVGVFINAQDWKNLTAKIIMGSTDETTCSAYVTIENSDQTTSVYYALVKLQSGWRIDDILWSKTQPSLAELLRQPM